MDTRSKLSLITDADLGKKVEYKNKRPKKQIGRKTKTKEIYKKTTKEEQKNMKQKLDNKFNKGEKLNGKKRMKSKVKNKLNRNKYKKRKRWTKKEGKKQVGSPRGSTCHNVTCLNNLLYVLKIDKDSVQNFIQQKKRIDDRLTLAGVKS